MKKRIAKLWVKALKSGKYKKGRGQLRDYMGQFCCLGVLCDLHAQAHPEIAATQTNPEVYLKEDAFLPQEVMDWAGMKTFNGLFLRGITKSLTDSLAGINDLTDTFEPAAKAIEKHRKDL